MPSARTSSPNSSDSATASSLLLRTRPVSVSSAVDILFFSAIRKSGKSAQDNANIACHLAAAAVARLGILVQGTVKDDINLWRQVRSDRASRLVWFVGDLEHQCCHRLGLEGQRARQQLVHGDAQGEQVRAAVDC